MYQKNISKILGLLMLLALLGCSRSFTLDPVREGLGTDSGVFSDGRHFSEERKEAKPEKQLEEYSGHKAAWALLIGDPSPAYRSFNVPSNNGYSIVVDKAGNTYVMGNFRGNTHFGKLGVKQGAISELFIAKLNARGEFMWVITGGCEKGDGALSLDHEGFLYAVGHCRFSTHGGKFGDRDLDFQEVKRRVFAVKLDSKGHVLWFQSGLGVNEHSILEHVLDRKGNLYIAGTFESKLKLGKFSFTSKGFLVTECDNGSCPYERSCITSHRYYIPDCKPSSSDLFLTKLNRKGEYVWAKQFGGGYVDEVNDLAIDKDGVLYLTGWIGGESEDPKVEEKRKVRMGKYNVKPRSFLAKLNQKGKVIWLRSEKGLGFGRIEVDQYKNVYVMGYLKRKIDGIKNEWRGGTLFKMGADGKLIWAREYQLSNNSMALNKKGDLYLTGTLDHREVFGKYVLYIHGLKRCESTKECRKGLDCAEGQCSKKKCHEYRDSDGRRKSTCYHERSSVYVVKVSSSGDYLWAFSFGSKGDDGGYGIALDGLGGILLTGQFGEGGGAIGGFDFTSASDKKTKERIYIAKFLAR